MASKALYLQSHHLKPSPTLYSLSHPFSSSSSNNNNDNDDKPSPFSSYFSDIRSKLRQHQQHQQPPAFQQRKEQQNSSKENVASFDEIKKNLSDFRRRSSVPPPDFSIQQKTNTTPFQDLNPGNPNLSSGVGKLGNLSFDKIRESLRLMKGAAAASPEGGGSSVKEKMSLNSYRQSFRIQASMTGGGDGGVRKVIGGSVADLPAKVFGKEMKEKEGKGADKVSEDDVSNFELMRIYNHEELGQKLRELRPQEVNKGKKEESWFTLSELGERLKKLKVKEVELANSTTEGRAFAELRKGLSAIKESDRDKDNTKNVNFQSLGLLTPQSFSKSPPKEHLVEKYFHPDNMSAEEKLKLELKKVRDEFKLHESDCGSTRVQIAQLTSEILHLSSVLHKKDKHSRRGLHAKVQQRKKLLKYLRRTDWESYCFVLSKLGLRDNPDYKN